MSVRFALIASDIRALVAIGWPLILNNVFNIGVNVADTLMTGRLGAMHLAAIAVGSGVWLMLFLSGLGVLMALGPTVAHHFGARRFNEIGHDTRQALWLAMGISVFIIIAMRAMSPLLTWVGIEPPVVILAQGYLNALSWGVTGCYLYHVLRQLNEGIGRTIPIMFITGIALPINVALNYTFVFGKFGVEPLGAIGCGLGTGLTFWGMFLLLAIYTSRAAAYRPYDIWSVIEAPALGTLQRLVGLGWPIGISLMLQSGLFTTLALLMGSLGTKMVAAHQVTLNYAGLVYMLPLGLGFATAVKVGQAMGRQEPQAARRIGLVGITLCWSVASTIGVLTFCFAPHIANLYTKDPEVVTLSAALLAISAVLQMGDGTQSAAAGALRGLKDTRIPMLINAFIYWGIGFVTGYVLGIKFGLGAQGIWIGLATALCTAAIALTVRFIVVMRRLSEPSPHHGMN